MSLQSFAPARGQNFDLSIGGASMALTLVEAKPLPARAGMWRQPFALLFRSASQIILPQRLYSLCNVTIGLGTLDIFLVPVARDQQGVLYQAIFN